MYPGKSGLHESMPAQLKQKRLPPHAEKHLSNGCGGWLFYTAWEICSCRCILGHPYIRHTLLHPQLILLNQGSETPQGPQHSAGDVTKVLTLTGLVHLYFTSPRDWSGAWNTEVLPTVVTVKGAQFLQSDTTKRHLTLEQCWWCSANKSKPECCVGCIKGSRRVTKRINCKKHEFSGAEMKKNKRQVKLNEKKQVQTW